VIDPRRTATCDAATLHMALRPGTDTVLFNGLLHYLHQHNHTNREFLEAHTQGYSPAQRAARDTAPSISAVAKRCALPEGQVTEFYERFSRTEKVVTIYSQGVNQSSYGTDKVNSIINCHLATGRIGKPGMGPFSITGQPNAMGGREVGGLANQLAAHMDFTPQDIDRLGRFWRASNIAQGPGLKAVDMFQAVAEGRVKAIWIMGTNPVVSMPDADTVKAALERCELVVVSDACQHTDTVDCASIRLPAQTWGEKDGTVTNSERRISRQRRFLPRRERGSVFVSLQPVRLRVLLGGHANRSVWLDGAVGLGWPWSGRRADRGRDRPVGVPWRATRLIDDQQCAAGVDGVVRVGHGHQPFQGDN
jgi:assimilatory nitrate reductase catalytic subunit